jgi:DNA-binding transcriptional LysR family regulator
MKDPHIDMQRIHVPAPTSELKALSRINLNLFLALDALLAEHSVTRAAKRVGLSQSAMSHTLAELRRIFDDPLLVRGRGGAMTLTRRALELVTPVRRGLAELDRAVGAPGQFEPKTIQRTFTLVAGDYLTLFVLPPLLEILAREAPQIDIDVRGADANSIFLLETQQVDLVLGALSENPPGIRRQKLMTESFAVVARRGHPALRDGVITLDDYVRLPHALISPRREAWSPVDQALLKEGRRRRVALRVPYFAVAPLVVAQSDLILTAPRRLAEEFSRTYPLQLLEQPIELPSFDILQFWHERFDDDPAHRGLREAVVRATAWAQPEVSTRRRARGK